MQLYSDVYLFFTVFFFPFRLLKYVQESRLYTSLSFLISI